MTRRSCAAGSAGGVAGPIVFGQLIERLSYTTTWLIVGSWVLAAAVLTVVSAVSAAVMGRRVR